MKLLLAICILDLLGATEKNYIELLIIPGAAFRVNFVRCAKFLILWLVLGAAAGAALGVFVAVFHSGGVCLVAVGGGFAFCAGGMALTAFLLKKSRRGVSPLWLPALAGGITGGLLIAIDYPFSSPDRLCWASGIVCLLAIILFYAAMALTGKLIRPAN